VLSMTSLLARTIRLHGHRLAVRDEELSFSWAEFGDRIMRAVGVLMEMGLRKGDRFGLIGRNSFRFAELLNAGYWLGAVPVPINHRLAPPEIQFILDDAQCKILVLEEDFIGLLETQELAPWQNRLLYLASRTARVEWPQYESLLGDAEAMPAHDAAEDDDALLLYTGGTTGRSKGVRLSHRNLSTNALQITAEMGPREDDLYLHVAPMFHSAALVGNAYVAAGAAQCFLKQPSGQAVLGAIARDRVTVTMLPPTLIILMLQDEAFASYDLASLRQFIFGSAPLAPRWIRRARDAFAGVEIWHGYGLTETSPILTIGKLGRTNDEIAERLDSVGHLVAATDLRIVDDDGREVAAGDPGEVVVRGPQVTKGYLNLPGETAEALRDGWFHTGDVGRTDESGYLFLLDRKKDMVITGGENVYTAEIEAVLCEHPLVREVAVFGVPDDCYGEALFAVIVPMTGEPLDEFDVIRHCRGIIGGYKIPRRIAFAEQLPKSATGKVLKAELRRRYGAGA